MQQGIDQKRRRNQRGEDQREMEYFAVEFGCLAWLSSLQRQRRFRRTDAQQAMAGRNVMVRCAGVANGSGEKLRFATSAAAGPAARLDCNAVALGEIE